MPRDASIPIVREPIELPGEIWKLIPESEGRYEASNLGRIRSLKVGCNKGTIDRKVPLVCTPYDNGKGYLVFNMRLSGGYVCRQVGSLILEAHVGPPPGPEYEAAHLDGDKLRNVPENLMWATPAVNASHKKLHGTQPVRACQERSDGKYYQCTQCGEWKHVDLFHRLTRKHQSVCGIHSACRECSNAQRIDRRRRARKRLNRPAALSVL